MKKILPYILIAIIFLQLFVPFTIGNGVKNNLEVRVNKAEAVGQYKVAYTAAIYPNSIAENFQVFIKDDKFIDGAIKLKAELLESASSEAKVLETIYPSETGTLGVIREEDVSGYDKKLNWTAYFTQQLTPNTTYGVRLYIWQKEFNVSATVIEILTYDNFTIESPDDIVRILISETTPPSGTTGAIRTDVKVVEGNVDGLPVCSILPPKLGGCIAQGFYYVFFKPTSFIFALTGKLLDFTIKYSIDDNSYRSSFVVEGWGLIRDFVNMFFIFILLYIAFGTILNLHSVKTKEMIINVVIIGLLMNFSLFATQIIIDASNILTRVFYNQNTIKTGTSQKNSSGDIVLVDGKPIIVSELGDFNEIKLSEAIVSKVDPQQLIINSKEVNSIKTRNSFGEEEETTSQGLTTGSFIIITILATVINVVGSIAFLSSAFIFISRVVMLWLAMILAPLAFFSYTVPALQDVKMIGWKKWWPDTLKMAFVAPVFAFFMYLIVGFLSKGLDVVNASLTTGYHGLSFVVAITVPFIFIMALLMKAKSIAVDMSGEAGTAFSKAGAAIGGVGLAAVTGGTAMALRGTVGNLGNKLATSKFASTTGAVGRTFGDLGKFVGSKSFDIRATKLGATAGKEMGVDMGKAKTGGYAKDYSDKVERRMKRAKELEVHENEPIQQKINKAEMDLQVALNKVAVDFERIDKGLVGARQRKADAKAGSQEEIEAIDTIKALNKEKSDIKNKTIITEGENKGRTITEMETKIIPDAKNAKQKENRTRRNEYAKKKTSWSREVNKEAEHKIIMETKLDSGEKH